MGAGSPLGHYDGNGALRHPLSLGQPGHELRQQQQFYAEQEQQRYNNEINLALAKNYHNPTTTVVHKNPSAEFDTIQRMLNPSVNY